LIAVLAVALPHLPDGDRAGAQEGDLEEHQQEQAEVRERQGEVDLQVNILEVHSADVTEALTTLQENVATRQAELDTANDASAAADEALTAAEDAVAIAQVRVLELQAQANTLAAESFMSPPQFTTLDSLRSESFSDVAIVQGLLDLQSETEQQVLDDLDVAEADLEDQRDTKADAASDADSKRLAAEDQLRQVTAARDQQARFVAAAQEALDQRLAESAQLADRDDALSQQIAADQAELARQLQALADQLPEPSAPQTSGSVTTATVGCSNGDRITVAASISDNVQSLLNAAAADGVHLCGWGYRSTDAQIQLRREHCGPSDYEIWDMPSSQCNPPTARPGTSEHEVGLAIDFTCDGGQSIGSHSSPCFVWLDGHAADYGLINYPVEPWHWSTTGS
jgi:LAS superfamily LD-carboxypeptidase LdcB